MGCSAPCEGGTAAQASGGSSRSLASRRLLSITTCTPFNNPRTCRAWGTVLGLWTSRRSELSDPFRPASSSRLKVPKGRAAPADERWGARSGDGGDWSGAGERRASDGRSAHPRVQCAAKGIDGICALRRRATTATHWEQQHERRAHKARRRPERCAAVQSCARKARCGDWTGSCSSSTRRRRERGRFASSAQPLPHHPRALRLLAQTGAGPRTRARGRAPSRWTARARRPHPAMALAAPPPRAHLGRSDKCLRHVLLC